jgi:hypothetical protein
LTQASISCRDRFSVVPLVAYTFTAMMTTQATTQAVLG